MIERNTNEVYDERRCRTCGASWEPWHDEKTGESGPGHSPDLPCYKYHPYVIPAWVGLAAAKIDQAAIARRELVGGMATTEFDHRANGVKHQ